MDTSTRIGWVGLGVMGRSMCGRLLAAAYPMTVHTRTKASAATVVEQGAVWVDSPRGVTERSDVVITMVGLPRDVRAVYFGDAGLLSVAHAEQIFIDMTTTEPQLSQEIAEAARARGADAIDGPVSGGDVGARNGTLSIMLGGDHGVVVRVTPLLQHLGKTIIHQGGPGAGQHAKMCNQIVIAGTMIGVCESLLYGYKAGLNLPTLLQAIRGGAAGCWSLDNYAPRILARNFDPGFMVDHFVKDMAIALDEARRMRMSLPGLALVHELYVALQAQGQGRRGTHALICALEHLSNVELPRIAPAS